jgi:hypothetical protein
MSNYLEDCGSEYRWLFLGVGVMLALSVESSPLRSSARSLGYHCSSWHGHSLRAQESRRPAPDPKA